MFLNANLSLNDVLYEEGASMAPTIRRYQDLTLAQTYGCFNV